MANLHRQRLGLYGGSFNPIHLGHRLVADAALEELQLDRLVFIPAARSPFKPEAPELPAAARLRLLRLALAGEPRYAVDARELERGGISYTIDTLRDYRSAYPETDLFYLIGADHVPLLPKWRDASSLAQLAEFVVVSRPGKPDVSLPPPFQGRHLRGFPIDISSSQIRHRVRQGLPVEALVGSAVAADILNNRLYL